MIDTNMDIPGIVKVSVNNHSGDDVPIEPSSMTNAFDTMNKVFKKFSK